MRSYNELQEKQKQIKSIENEFIKGAVNSVLNWVMEGGETKVIYVVMTKQRIEPRSKIYTICSDVRQAQKILKDIKPLFFDCWIEPTRIEL